VYSLQCRGHLLKPDILLLSRIAICKLATHMIVQTYRARQTNMHSSSWFGYPSMYINNDRDPHLYISSTLLPYLPTSLPLQCMLYKPDWLAYRMYFCDKTTKLSSKYRKQPMGCQVLPLHSLISASSSTLAFLLLGWYSTSESAASILVIRHEEQFTLKAAEIKKGVGQAWWGQLPLVDSSSTTIPLIAPAEEVNKTLHKACETMHFPNL